MKWKRWLNGICTLSGSDSEPATREEWSCHSWSSATPAPTTNFEFCYFAREFCVLIMHKRYANHTEEKIKLWANSHLGLISTYIYCFAVFFALFFHLEPLFCTFFKEINISCNVCSRYADWALLSIIVRGSSENKLVQNFQQASHEKHLNKHIIWVNHMYHTCNPMLMHLF